LAQVARRGRCTLAAAGGALALAIAACDAARVSELQKSVAATPPAPSRPAPDLVLIGVVEAGGAGTAIIAGRGGAQAAYGVGDAVRPGLVLERISGDGVLLAAGESRYRLRLMPSAAAAGTLAAGEPRTIKGRPNDALSSWQSRNSSPDSPEDGRLTPYPGGGMRLEGVRPDSPYAKLGLQVGDVLLSVNRAPVESPEQLMRLYRSRRFGAQEVEVLRDGRFETLRFGPG
jgi:type II secretory pathway component PulC